MAGPFQNYQNQVGSNTLLTAPYGATRITDLITVPAFASYVAEAIYEQSALIRSGAVVRNAALDARAGGVRIEVPTWRPIDPQESVIGDDNTWGGGGGQAGQGYLVPQRVTAGKQIAPIMHRGFAYSASDLSRLSSGQDALGFMRTQLADAINKLKEVTLFSQLKGLFGATGGSGALIANSTEVAADVAPGTLKAENFLSAASAIAAKAKLGERAGALDIIAMPSAVYFYLQQTGMLTFSSDSLSTGGGIKWGGGGVGVTNDAVAYFAGMRVIVTDNIAGEGFDTTPTTGNALKYPVYMFSSGAVMEGVQQELTIEADRNILSLQDVVSVHQHYGYHIAGTSYSGTADNPSNTALSTSSNWSLIYTKHEMVPVVRLLVNSPFGGVS
jgi:hypothetical protein